MNEIRSEDLESVSRWHFAVGGLQTQSETIEIAPAIRLQNLIDTNFKFFKQINDKPDFAAFLNDLLFDRYAERKSQSSGPESTSTP